MSAEEPYFQFPLCALAYESDVQKRLDHIISYAVVDAGRKLWTGLDEDEQAQRRERAELDDAFTKDFDFSDDDHMAVWLGAKATRVKLVSIKWTVKEHDALLSFCRQRELIHGKDASVRIKASLAWEAKSGSGMTYKEFSILCAIYSCIGANHGPVRIVRDSIKARSLGFKSMEALLTRNEGKPIPTDWDIRSTVDKLHALGWFSRCHPSRRQTFFSNRLTDDELREAIIKRKTYQAEFKAKQRAKDGETAEAIRSKLSSTIIGTPSTIIEPPEPAKPPPDDHQDTAIVPPLDHHYNKNSSNRNSLNRNSLIEIQEIPAPLDVLSLESHLTKPTKEQFDHYLEEFSKGRPDHEVRVIQLEAITLWDDLQHGRFKGLWMGELVRRTA